MTGVTYDTGALIAAERNDRRMWAMHSGFLAEEVAPVVPAPVLAEAWRGGPRQANVARLLAMCTVEWMTEDQARQVDILAGCSGHDDIVDVTVVEGAARRGDAVVTSNREHIEKIAQTADVALRIEDVDPQDHRCGVENDRFCRFRHHNGDLGALRRWVETPGGAP